MHFAIKEIVHAAYVNGRLVSTGMAPAMELLFFLFPLSFQHEVMGLLPVANALHLTISSKILLHKISAFLFLQNAAFKF